jgi:HSP20 family protein
MKLTAGTRWYELCRIHGEITIKFLTIKLNVMTLVKFQRPKTSFSLMDEFLKEMPKLFGDVFAANQTSFVPVNIIETKDAYQIEVVAPGMEKNDFNVSIEKDILTISGEKQDEVKEENEKLIRSEYHYRSFKRSFTLDENVDAEKIDAKYLNGVLTLNLPKRVEVKASKAIEVK